MQKKIMEIKVKVKTVFGKERYYPDCDKSELFRKMTRSATLLPHAIKCIKKLGYRIIVTHDIDEL